MSKGRPGKVGLDYFAFDVDFFEDEKIQFVSARFGIKGEIVAIKLLCKIYRNGFYIRFGEDEQLLFAKRAGENVTPALVNEIVIELVKRGFFDKTLFNSFGILTSNGIQKRYFSAISRRNDNNLKNEDTRFLIKNSTNILPENGQNLINVDNKSINVDINSNFECINATKERKGKERKEDNTLPSGNASETPISDQCPHEEIRKLYNSILPELPSCKIRNKTFDANTRSRWKEDKDRQKLEWWRYLFSLIRESDFLMGRTDRPFMCSLDWIVKPTNMTKILNGNYKNKINGNDKHNNFKEKVYECTPDEEISWMRD